MIELKLNGIDENLTLKRENQYSKKDLDDAVQKAQDAAVLSETSADIAIDAKDDALESANNALLSAQSAKEDADRAERAAEQAEGLPLASKATGNPLKLESTEAPIIDFVLHGFTEKIDDKIHSLGQTYGCVDLGSLSWSTAGTNQSGKYEMKCDTMKALFKLPSNDNEVVDLHCEKYQAKSANDTYKCNVGISVQSNGTLFVYDDDYNTSSSASDFKASVQGLKLYYPLADNATPSEYAIRVDEVGKNLADESKVEYGYYYSTGGKQSNPKCATSGMIKVEKGKTYIGTLFDANKQYVNKTVYATFANETDVKAIRQVTSDTVTIEDGENYLRVRNYDSFTITQGNSYFQLEEGSDATEYSKYQGQTVFIPTLNPLQDGDSISYHVDGTGTEHRKYGIVDLGTLNWYYATYFRAPLHLSAEVARIETPKWICTNYDVVSIQTLTTTTENALSKNNSDNNILVRDSSYTDATSFKSAMQGVMLIYELAEPTDTDLTAEQIAELKKLKTYKSETNISTEELGSMDIQYYCDNANADVVADIQRQVNEKESGSAESYHVYSLEEKVVGEWIDGKPIYEKFYRIDANLSTSATNVVAKIDNVLEIEDIIEAKAIRTKTNPVSGGVQNSPSMLSVSAWKESNTSFKVYAQTTWSNVPYLILQYTKISDSARMAQPMLLSDDAITEPNNSDTI